MNKILKYSAFSVLLAVMAGCTEDNITPQVGALPDEAAMNIVGGRLLGNRSLLDSQKINLYEGDTPRPEKISYALTKPAASEVTLKAIVAPTLVDAYNEEYNTEFAALPADNVTLGNGGTLTIAAGKQIAAPIDVSISTEGLQTDITYLLPITVAGAATKAEARTDKQILYYKLYIQKEINEFGKDFNKRKIPQDFLPDLNMVVYVNTEADNPLVVDGYGFWNLFTDDYYKLGNIINLKKATIEYDASTQRALFKLGNDLGYILDHSDKYLRQLTTHGHKICICIENGGKGVGFCNMSDAQIADFTVQVKEVITRYNLDGVNLWDDDSQYGKAGMPEMNTTSYPKLIKALREALPGKLLTLVDKGNATGTFYDVDKCGGIAVGKYIDYAWHGYFSISEKVQIINPDDNGAPQPYSDYTRRRIAGLDDTRYGSVTLVRFDTNYTYDSKLSFGQARMNMQEMVDQWAQSSSKKSNIWVLGSDFIANKPQPYENAQQATLDFVGEAVSDFNTSLYMNYLFDEAKLYNKNAGYQKDW